MTLSMNDNLLVTVEQLEAFVSASRDMSFVGGTRREKYTWIERLLTRFWYRCSRKKNKNIIKQYAMKMTGYSDAQMTRLLSEYVKTRHIVLKESKTRPCFAKRYTTNDIARLIETDSAHGTLSGKATREVFQRSFKIFSDERFLRLKDISVSHLYNLRETRQYVSNSLSFTKTSSIRSSIGERRKPSPDDKPGYIRVDSVHQGDMEGEKGVYHINLVDEVLQWEIVCCVEAIREEFLLPVLQEALKSFPFIIRSFHSDNGSEYINYEVAKMLNEMMVKQTKSRPRHSNDNALAETKNGSVIRKHMGYIHIPRRHANQIQIFYKTHFNAYLNFHRPSGFATTIIDKKGRGKKAYNLYETPYEHLKKLPSAELYLKPGVTFAYLDKLAYATDDNTCATLMQKARRELFKSFRT